MKTFKEYYEEETINEGFAQILGKVLGVGTTTVLSAWIAALLFKGGVGAINSFANTMGKQGVVFKKNLNKEKTSAAVRNQENKMNEAKEKYKSDIEPVLNAIKEKNFEVAANEYLALPIEKKNSTEIKKIIVEEVINATKQLPIDEPTPGNECYRGLKKIMGLAVAKSLSRAIQEQATKYVQQQGV